MKTLPGTEHDGKQPTAGTQTTVSCTSTAADKQPQVGATIYQQEKHRRVVNSR